MRSRIRLVPRVGAVLCPVCPICKPYPKVWEHLNQFCSARIKHYIHSPTFKWFPSSCRCPNRAELVVCFFKVVVFFSLIYCQVYTICRTLRSFGQKDNLTILEILSSWKHHRLCTHLQHTVIPAKNLFLMVLVVCSSPPLVMLSLGGKQLSFCGVNCFHGVDSSLKHLNFVLTM